MNIKKMIYYALEFMKGILIFILYYFLSALFATLFKNNDLFLFLSNIFLLLILFFIYYKVFIKDFKSFKKEYLDDAFKYWLIGLLIMYASNIILTLIFKDVAPNEALNRESLKNSFIYTALSVTLIGPFIEEIVFRLSFKKAFNNIYIYAIFSALLFSSIHVIPAIIKYNNYLELLYLIPYGSLGYFFAYAYYKTNNIFTPIFMHIIHNTLAVIILVLGAL